MRYRKENIKRKYSMKEILDDLCSRFILNCPDEAYDSYERLFFQIEEAHWFYEDFYREQQKSLPEFKFKEFVTLVFEHCPLLRCDPKEVEKHLENFLHYKQRVNVYGAIILNPTLDKVLLVKGWYSRSSWGFPRGKVNKNENEVSCAIREVFEEIGYDLTGMIDPNEFIELKIREQNIKLFIVHGVPETTNFAPRTRKEISKIEWHLVNDIGRPTNGKKSVNRYWTIMPFIRLLKKWISVKHKEKRRRATGKRVPHSMSSSTIMQSSLNNFEYKVPKMETKKPMKQLFLEPAPVKQENALLEHMKTGGTKRTSMRNFSFNKDEILSTFRQKVTTSV